MTGRWTRRSALALLGSGAGLLAWGSGGFTDISADRDTDVDTTADPSGLLGIETLDDQLVFEAETRDLVELTNNTGAALDTIDVVVDSQPTDFTVSVESVPGGLTDGETGSVSATITGAGSNCDEQAGTVGLEITARREDGSGNVRSTITADREVSLSVVNCINFENEDCSGYGGSCKDYQTPTGFVPDRGSDFGLRDEFDPQSTLEYGWNRDQTDEARGRVTNNPIEEKTLNHFNENSRIPTGYDKSQDGFWEFDLPAGWYDVTMVCHDPAFLDQEYSFDVDGGATVVQLRDSEFDDQDNERASHRETYEFTVEVVSGETLRIVPPDGTYNPKITWLRFEANTASFDVRIDSFDDPVTEGEDVDVDVTVENTGEETDTQTIQLDVDRDGDGSFDVDADDTEITLDSGEATPVTLTYTTTGGDASAIDFAVKSEQDRKERNVTVEQAGLSSTGATNMVPNVDQQQQTFRFTLGKQLPENETATITLPNAPQDDTVLDYNNEGVVDDEGEGGSISRDESGGDVVFTYADGETIAEGTSVELRVPQIDLGSESDQNDPYEYEFERSDTTRTTTYSVGISRDVGDAELTDVEVTDLTGTNAQTQEISFTPTTDMVGIDSVDELVSIDLTDAAALYANESVKSVNNATVDAFDVQSDEAYLRVKADNGVSTGTEITVTLEDVEPVATGESYEIGFSRGAADTTSTTFSTASSMQSAGATDIVPNADTQQQTVTFTPDSALPDSATVIITLDDAQAEVGGSSGQVDYTNEVAQVVGGGGQVNDFSADDQTAHVEYEPPSGGVSAGQTVTIRIEDIKVADLSGQSDPYTVEVERDDDGSTATTTFGVTRGGGDAKLDEFSITDLAGTGEQTQCITFAPSGSFDGGEAVAIELNDAAIDGSVDYEEGVTVVDGSAQDTDMEVRSDTVFVTYEAPTDGFSGTVELELETVTPQSGAYSDGAYTVGVSRGSADTTNDTFEVVPMADLVRIDENAGWTFDTATGQTGVAFDITNGSSDQAVVVTEVGVDSASAGNTTVVEVRNGSSSGEFGILERRQSNTDFGDVLLNLQGESLDVQGDNTAGLDSSLDLQPGDSEPIGLNEFRDASDKTVNMNKSGGGDATVRLVFDDGSEDTYAFQSLDNQPP